MQERPFLQTEDVLEDLLGGIAGKSVLDIGAGSGLLAEQLSALGARTVGIEPNRDFVARARSRGSDAHFIAAPAEAIPLDAGTFDVSVFSFSLHHASEPEVAINEARRVTRAGGRIVVIEPEAPDPIFPAMRFIDDESLAYDRVQRVLDEAVASGVLQRTRTLPFASKYRVETPDDMIDDVVSIDSGRVLRQSDRPAFEAAFLAARCEDALGCYLPYWSRADLFELPPGR